MRVAPLESAPAQGGGGAGGSAGKPEKGRLTSVTAIGGDVKATFHSLREEVLRAADGTTIQDRDTDAALSFIDKVICVSSSVSAPSPSVEINPRVSVPWQVTYLLSNAMAADAGTRFYLLGTVVSFCFVCVWVALRQRTARY